MYSHNMLITISIISAITSIWFVFNTWHKRESIRSAYMVKAIFTLIVGLWYVAIRNLSEICGVKMVWLVYLTQFMYSPVIQIILILVVIFLNLFINQKWKQQKII